MARHNHSLLLQRFTAPLLQDGTPVQHMTATEKRDAAPGVIRHHLDILDNMREHHTMALRLLPFVKSTLNRGTACRAAMAMHRYWVAVSVLQLRAWVALAE